MENLLPIIQIALSIILVIAIILQKSAAGLGGAFGDNWSSAHHTRRGAEKQLFIATIIIALLFAVSAVVAILG